MLCLYSCLGHSLSGFLFFLQLLFCHMTMAQATCSFFAKGMQMTSCREQARQTNCLAACLKQKLDQVHCISCPSPHLTTGRLCLLHRQHLSTKLGIISKTGCKKAVPWDQSRLLFPPAERQKTLKEPLVPLMLCCGISSCTPSIVQKCIWKLCLFYLRYSHVIAERDGTREKADTTSHQLSLYTAKVLPEHTLDTVLDLGSRGPEGSRAPKGKRVCTWY